MKKIIFFIILSEVLLSLTLSIERNKNSIIPYYLRLGSNETLITLKTSYDTLTHKASASANLHVYIKLFEKEKKGSKNFKNSNNKNSIYQFDYKSSLGIKSKNKKPSLSLKNSLKITFNNFTFYEEITPYIPCFYTESTTLEYKTKNKVLFFNKSFIYKTAGMNYSLGINFYKLLLPKYVNSITFSINGNTSKRPIFYSYNISTSYRFPLFHKKYFYFSLNPYILISKDYAYKIKPAINLSLNYNF